MARKVHCADCCMDRTRCRDCRELARSRNPITCPECKGKGGGVDYDGEWYECHLCRERREVTRRQLSVYRLHLRALDRWCEAEARREGWTT